MKIIQIIFFLFIIYLAFILITELCDRIETAKIKKNIIIVKSKKNKSNENSGSEGESIVAKTLKKLNPEEYLILNDIMIETSFGTSQIDHVVISKRGIFVIETKHYSGLIFGNETNANWTQQFNRGKTLFHNPVMQNFSHVMALKSALGIDKDSLFIPIVVFSHPDVRLSVDTVKESVVIIRDLLFTIKSKKGIVFTNDEVISFYNSLNEKNITSKEKRLEHIEKLKS